MITQQLRELITRRMSECGLSTNELGIAVGIHPSHLSKFLHGEANLSPPKLENLMRQLGLRVNLEQERNAVFHQRRAFIPPRNEITPLQPDLESARGEDAVFRSFYDGLEQSVVGRFGQRIEGQKAQAVINLLTGSQDRCRIVALDPTGGSTSQVLLQEGDSETTSWLLAAVELRPLTVTAGPLAVPARFWPPDSPESEIFAAGILGGLVGRALDLLLSSELPNMPTASIASTDAESLAEQILTEASGQLFASLPDGRPRGLILVSPTTLSTLIDSASDVYADQLADGHLLGMPVIPCDLPALGASGSYVAAVIPRDRLVYRLEDLEVSWGAEQYVENGLLSLRARFRGDVRAVLARDEAIGFTLAQAGS